METNLPEVLSELEQRVGLALHEQLIVHLMLLDGVSMPTERRAVFLFQFGTRASAAGQDDLASRLYEESIHLGFHSSELYYNLGNARLRLGRFPAAIDAYTAALAIAPDHSFAHYNRGLCFRRCQNATSALEDFNRAALLGCTYPGLYATWSTALHETAGFEALARLVERQDLPSIARDALAQAFEEMIGQVCYVLQSDHDNGITFSPNTLRLRGLLADAFPPRFGNMAERPETIGPTVPVSSVGTLHGGAIRAVLLADVDENGKITNIPVDLTSVRRAIARLPRPETLSETTQGLEGVAWDQAAFEGQVHRLFQGVADARALHDAEMEWRTHYLLGVLPYSAVASQVGVDGSHRRNDYPEICGFIAFPDEGDAADLVAANIGRYAPDIHEVSRDRTFGRFAQRSFAHAADILARPSRLADLPKTWKSMDAHWYTCEDVYRELVRTSVFLGDAEGFVAAVDQARLKYAELGARVSAGGEGRSAEAYVGRLRAHFGPVSIADLGHALGDGGVLLDYYTYEVVEDTVACAAVSGPETVLSEQFVNTLNSQGDADLETMIRTNEQWTDHDRVPTVNYPERIDELLFQRQEPALRGCSRLAIAPFNYLHNVPFHALRSIRARIASGELRELVYVPSARFLASVSSRVPMPRLGLSCLFVGFSAAGDISHDAELQVVREWFPGTRVLTGDAATVGNVLQEIGGHDVVHLCCHGRYDRVRNCTYLALADGGLYPSDLVGLDGFDPELVFANACVTGVATRASPNGDQTLGIHTALLLAGARQVIATMWPAHDEAALFFARRFYGEWLNEPQRSTADVYVRTQTAVKRAFPDLLSWGTHALFGDWR